MAKDRGRILDAYLVASGRLGDREALGSLARRWNGKLLTHAWRLLRDHEGARDAVQESWAEILRAVLLLASLAVKLAVAPPIHANQIMRELKRIELQLARARKANEV